MAYTAHRNRKKTLKANFTSLFFLLVILGLTIFLLVISTVGRHFLGEFFMPAPVAFVTAEVQKPFSHTLPEILTIPVVRADVAVEDVPQKQAVVIPKAVQKISQAHLIIPKIGVAAVIQDMGVTPTGAMAVPDNRIDVGWYSLGTRPGETGSAVIGGHNVWDSGAAVFVRLDQLEKGDVLSVVDAKGISTAFVVRDMRTYDATDTNTGIFQSASGRHLNLITCSGSWDPSTNTYTKRLVVFTDVM